MSSGQPDLLDNKEAQKNMPDQKYVSEAELNAISSEPRVTLENLEKNIAFEHYFTAYEGVLGERFVREKGETDAGEDSVPKNLKLLTLCILTLKNGFMVVGTSACASKGNYDRAIGQKVARGDAVRQVWGVMGYALRDHLDRLKQAARGDDQLGEALTRMTAYALGNKDSFDISHADAILDHFKGNDHAEEGGRTAGADVSAKISTPVVPAGEPAPDALDETVEVETGGIADIEKIREPSPFRGGPVGSGGVAQPFGQGDQE
jgi:hypothetical protein